MGQTNHNEQGDGGAPEDGDRLLTRAEAAGLLYAAADHVSPNALYRLVREGTKVRGVAERIRLKCTMTPAGIRYRLADIRAYQAAVQAAHDEAAGIGAPADAGEERVHLNRLPRLARPAFERCAEHEIGTYPTTSRGLAAGKNHLATDGRSTRQRPRALTG